MPSSGPTASEPAPPPVVHVRWMTYLCYAGMICLAAGMSHYPIILSRIATSFSLSAQESGQVGGAVYIGTIAAVAILTPLSQKYGEKFAMIVSLAACAIASIAESFAVSFFTVTAALFTQGLGCGGLDLLLSPVVAAMHRDNVTVNMSYLHSFYSIGAVASTLLSTALVSYMDGDADGWRIVPRSVAVLPLIVAVAFSREAFPDIVEGDAAESSGDGNGGEVAGSPTNPNSNSEMGLKELMLSKIFILCMVLMFLAGASEQGPVVWLPTFVEEALGFNTTLSGLSLTVFSVWMSAGRIGGGRFAGNWNPFWILMGSAAMQAVLIVASGVLAPLSPVLAYGTSTMIGLAISMMWPTVLAIAAEEFPNGGTKMFGILTVFGGLGATAMSWLVGIVKDLTQSTMVAFETSAMAGALCLFLSWMAKQLHDAHQEEMQAAAEGTKMEDIAGKMAIVETMCVESPRSSVLLTVDDLLFDD